jgi:hypothetical protein
VPVLLILLAASWVTGAPISAARQRPGSPRVDRPARSAGDSVSGTIRTWIWSGFHTPEDVEEMLSDILDEGTDEGPALRLAQVEFATKRRAEKGWPATTDCDRLDRAFESLWKRGVLCLHNAGGTISDGVSDVSEALAEHQAGRFSGYCFYHEQDVERALASGLLPVAFGGLDEDEKSGATIGTRVRDALRAAGLRVEWNGKPDSRLIVRLDWKRRAPPDDRYRDPGLGAADSADLARFIGTWRGSSVCVNRESAPACTDETVVYEVRRLDEPGTATLKANKVVDGQRIPMYEFGFAYDRGQGCWRHEFQTPRFHGAWCLRVEGDSMSGGLRALPEEVDVRKVTLTRE